MRTHSIRISTLIFSVGAIALAACGSTKVPEAGPYYGTEAGELGKDDSLRRPASVEDLVAGQVRSVTFSRTEQYRGFVFEGRQGDKVDLLVDGLGGLDSVIFVYRVSSTTGRAFGWPLAFNDDTTEAGWTVQTNSRHNPLSSSIVGFELPETRKYAVIATTYRQWYTGTAEVLLRAEPRRIQCSGLIGYPACPEGMFCEIEVANACGGADLPGYCQPQPEICTKEYRPVCGCDGVTYGNDCMRQSAAAQLDHTGECATSGGGVGATCGTRGAEPCSEGLFCQYSIRANCGRLDAPGSCQERPTACTREYRPVCGCDGQTYGNACVAAASGASVDYEGACLGRVGDVCGTLGAGGCAEGLWCRYPISSGCGWADGPGTCTQISEPFCTEQYEPVCGCDGNTYSNSCFAESAQVSVYHEGACESR